MHFAHHWISLACQSSVQPCAALNPNFQHEVNRCLCLCFGLESALPFCPHSTTAEEWSYFWHDQSIESILVQCGSKSFSILGGNKSISFLKAGLSLLCAPKVYSIQWPDPGRAESRWQRVIIASCRLVRPCRACYDSDSLVAITVVLCCAVEVPNIDCTAPNAPSMQPPSVCVLCASTVMFIDSLVVFSVCFFLFIRKRLKTLQNTSHCLTHQE